MPPVKRRPKYFRFKSFTPRNRTQQERIRIPQPAFRPFRLVPHDAIKREAVRDPNPEWWVLHRRGPKRPKIGADPLEARAVSHAQIRGTLPERILWLELVKRHWVPGLDFDFQSSLEGGRFELGGMVVDFIFRDLRVALRVQSVWHTHALQKARDREQAQALASFGFTVLDLWDETIYNSAALEEWLRRNLDFRARMRGQVETLIVPFSEVQ